MDKSQHLKFIFRWFGWTFLLLGATIGVVTIVYHLASCYSHTSKPLVVGGLVTSSSPSSYNHAEIFVAPLPEKSGIYKFCDGDNLVYELFSAKQNEYGAVASSIQVQFNSPKCVKVK